MNEEHKKAVAKWLGHVATEILIGIALILIDR